MSAPHHPDRPRDHWPAGQGTRPGMVDPKTDLRWPVIVAYAGAALLGLAFWAAIVMLIV